MFRTPRSPRGARLRPCVVSCLTALALVACTETTRPRIEAGTPRTADELEAIAAQLGSDPQQQQRQVALRIAASALRRGAPLATVTVRENGQSTPYLGAAMQWGIVATADSARTALLPADLVLWRGIGAKRVLHVITGRDTSATADTATSSTDSATFIGGASNEALYLGADTARWGHPGLSFTLATQPGTTACSSVIVDPSLLCYRTTTSISLDGTFVPLDSTGAVIGDTLRLSVPAQAFGSIKYVKVCGTSTPDCTISAYP